MQTVEIYENILDELHETTVIQFNNIIMPNCEFVNLEDICDIQVGEELDAFTENGFEVLNGYKSIGYCHKYNREANQLMISKTVPNNCCFVPKKYFLTSNGLSISSHHKIISNELLLYILPMYDNEFYECYNPDLSLDKLKKFKVPLVDEATKSKLLHLIKVFNDSYKLIDNMKARYED